tara:strand:- start:480 stop:686 length:207 start_codon:yes stop_codon:yes gene_type:complete
MNKPKTIADEYFDELLRATKMRWDLSYLVNSLQDEHPDISDSLQEILDTHAVKTKRPVSDSKGMVLSL